MFGEKVHEPISFKQGNWLKTINKTPRRRIEEKDEIEEVFGMEMKRGSNGKNVGGRCWKEN